MVLMLQGIFRTQRSDILRMACFADWEPAGARAVPEQRQQEPERDAGGHPVALAHDHLWNPAHHPQQAHVCRLRLHVRHLRDCRHPLLGHSRYPQCTSSVLAILIGLRCGGVTQCWDSIGRSSKAAVKSKRFDWLNLIPTALALVCSSTQARAIAAAAQRAELLVCGQQLGVWSIRQHAK